MTNPDPKQTVDSELNNILSRLTRNVAAKGSTWSSDYELAKSQLLARERRLVLEGRKEENESIENMIHDVLEDPRDFCYNHEQYVGQCYACRLIRWRKAIAKEYLRSIRKRIGQLDALLIQKEANDGTH